MRILDEIAARTGLERLDRRLAAASFVHPSSGQEFVVLRGGPTRVGLTGAELLAAWEEVRFDPEVRSWVDAHRRTYEAANPVRSVRVAPFLCGRTPLLGRAVERSGTDVGWSVHETAEHRGERAAAAMTAEGAARVLAHYGWEPISEVQWEFAARGFGETWAGGRTFRDDVDTLCLDPRFDPASEPYTMVWGLTLGEWVADEWHPSWEGAPDADRPWRAAPGPPGAVRGGGVLQAPWQDADEAVGCLAGARGGDGAWRGVFGARPVIRLPWVPGVEGPLERLEPEPYDAVLARYTEAWRRARDRQREVREARVGRIHRLEQELPGSVQHGTIRSVGPGVAVVRLAEVNGILRLPDGVALEVGEAVTVRIVGAGGVPDVELVSRP